MQVPKVMEEFITIQMILVTGASIGRYGDGEFRTARGSSLKFQDFDPELATRLQQILVSNDPGFLVGIPRVWGRRDLCFYDPQKHDNWLRCMSNPDFLNMLDMDKQYASAFITRPDAAIHIECDDYWNMVRTIWRGRRVVYFVGEGDGKPSKAMQGRGFLEEAKELKVEKCLPRQAWSQHKELIERAKQYDPKKWLIMLSLGPTATVVAYDLFKLGYQALDVGHMPMFYNRTHPKMPKFLQCIVDKYEAMGKTKET